MLCFRRETDYALQLVRQLASHKGYLSLKEFAKQSGISFWYMKKIAYKLSLANIIEAEQGVNGGYKLAVPAKKLTIYDVVKVMEGNPAMATCLEKNAECAVKGHKYCFWRNKMTSINKQFIKILRKEKITK